MKEEGSQWIPDGIFLIILGEQLKFIENFTQC